MSNSSVLVERAGNISRVIINRPKVLNALNVETLESLKQTFDSLADDRETLVVILTGSGDKAFVAGADIAELSDLGSNQAKAYAEMGLSTLRQIEEFPKPVIAAINGFCLGGGCELAMSCHIRLASETAKLGQPEVKLGLIPGFGGTQRLSRLVGRGRALELLLTGEMITASRAREMGLVNEVFPAADLMTEAESLAKKIVENGPVALRYCIEAVNTGLEVPLAQGLAMESLLFSLCFSTDDCQEGTQAFLEKRKPEFKGR